MKEQPTQAKMKPTIYFNYEFLKGAEIGDEIEFVGKGRITSMSEDIYEGKKSHTQRLEVMSIAKKGETMDGMVERMKRRDMK